MPIGKTDKSALEVKRAAAKRYEQRAKLTQSRPRKKTLMLHAESYRRQAEQIERQ